MARRRATVPTLLSLSLILRTVLEASAGTCGNGLQESGEQCEDGNTVRCEYRSLMSRIHDVGTHHYGLIDLCSFNPCFHFSAGGWRRLRRLVRVRISPVPVHRQLVRAPRLCRLRAAPRRHSHARVGELQGERGLWVEAAVWGWSRRFSHHHHSASGGHSATCGGDGPGERPAN